MGPSGGDDHLSAGSAQRIYGDGGLVRRTLAAVPGSGHVGAQHAEGALLGVAQELTVHGCMSHAPGGICLPMG